MPNVSLSRRRWLSLAGALCLPAAAQAAPPVVLAQVAAPDLDPSGWLVSEKFDGVRALWGGRTLRFRSGRPIAAPRWFLAGLPPDAMLDGELWLGRGRFEATSGLVRQTAASADGWRDLQYQVFELPGGAGGFAERAARIETLVRHAAFAPLRAVPQSRIDDRDALRRRLDAVVRGGGEGLMLHRADAPFVSGRTEALLKLKPFDDAEAMVVGYVPGQGRLAGRVGALRVRGRDGVEFAIGSGLRDADRAAPPPVGSLVTYTHRGVTRLGVPRFPTFLRRYEEG